MEIQRALVTGGTGFVGSNLVQELRERGCQVRCLVRDFSRAGDLTAIGAKLEQGSLSDIESLHRAVTDVDVVFHVAGRVAALKRQDFFLDNVEGTRSLVNVCSLRGSPPTLVYVSSLAAGGPSRRGRPRRETDLSAPVSIYGLSKLAAEHAAMEFADRVPISIVRPPMVFGRGDRNSLQLFRSVLKTRLHLVPGYRRMSMSIVHVADLCQALIEIAERGSRAEPCDPARGIYYITSGRSITYGEMGAMASQALGRFAMVVPAPKLVFWITGAMGETIGRLRRRPSLINWDKVREATASGWECSDEKLRNELAYSPAKSLEERFVETVIWYREQGWL